MVLHPVLLDLAGTSTRVKSLPSLLQISLLYQLVESYSVQSHWNAQVCQHAVASFYQWCLPVTWTLFGVSFLLPTLVWYGHRLWMVHGVLSFIYRPVNSYVMVEATPTFSYAKFKRQTNIILNQVHLLCWASLTLLSATVRWVFFCAHKFLLVYYTLTDIKSFTPHNFMG